MTQPRPAVIVPSGEGVANVGVITMAPGRDGPESHVHADEDDMFHVLEGELTFVLGSGQIAAPAGTFVLVPPGVEHTFADRTAVPVRVLNTQAPAGFDRRLMGS